MSMTAILAVASGMAGARAPDVSEFVPGQKMNFPIESAGVLDDYGRRLLVNCRTTNAAIEQACIAKLSERIATCQGGEPAVFETRESYAVTARRFGGCVMPIPICRGVEVSSIEECKAAAAGG
jgi:hypothetical protein